ncbi:MAG: bifunctional adenosylcobinamide kinase/adenosylcobinamide-phosphate guanylyltransferase [Candidatus Brocadia sp.]|jgi:adenosylcobinamide kinase/adenosylcobinamide-phosphate guanylyltransferase
MAKITFVLGGARSGKSAFAEGLARKYNDVVYIATAEVKDDEMRERIRAHRARRPLNWKTIESPYHIDKVVSDLNGKAGLVLVDCITLYITNMLLSSEKGVGRGEVLFDPTSLIKGGQSPPFLTPTKGGETGGRAIYLSIDGMGGGEDGKSLPDEIINSPGCSDLQTENLKQRQTQIIDKINRLSRACRESRSDAIIISNEVGLGIVPDNALSRVFRDVAGYANQILAEEADEVYFIVAGIAQKIK